jgi:hypothetical protein
MLLPQQGHHRAADSGVPLQAVCLTAIAVSRISNHELWLLAYINFTCGKYATKL